MSDRPGDSEGQSELGDSFTRTRQDVTSIAFDTTSALIVVLDRAGRVMRFNAACERLTGLTEAEVLGQVLWPLVLDTAEAARAAQVYAALKLDTSIRPYENYWMNASGEPRYIHWQSNLLPGASGEIDVVIATGVDVTEARHARLEREESEARFRALFERSGDGVVLMDPHDPEVPWRIVECNEAFARMNGYDRTELLGQSIDLLHENDLMAREGTRLLEWVRSLGDQAQGEGTHRHRDGHVFPIETRSSLITLGGRELVLGLDRDITERRKAQQALLELNRQLAYAAQHDALTGLPNRTMLMNRLEQELTRARRNQSLTAVMFVDLDHFKRVNDTLGHGAGDDLLREVARRCTETLRPTDLTARVGGDEFVVVLPDLYSVHHAARIALRLQENLTASVALEGLSVTVGCSVGISVFPQDGTTADELLRHADLAMYEVKRTGKNATRFFTAALNDTTRARLQMEGQLRAAIRSDGLSLHYQPQVNATSGTLTGLEALARWDDPELGVVSPGEFIPLAEDTGLIVALGTWVLREACRQAAAWRLTVPVSVNVSPAQLVRADFPEVVRSTLSRYGIQPSLLKLEITERLNILDPEQTNRNLKALQGLGVPFSLDDFGAGQSALASLLKLPLQEVKLDRSLLTGVTGDPASWRVLSAVIELARGLDLQVVAEGVETHQQLEVLRTLQCETVQGYLTGRPVPAENITQRLQKWKLAASDEIHWT
ncbi:putative bifunctional diguanylate cyclase/phosphodiesterase [Deinococcus sp. A31D244]|uniref:putative bifunctional diguanylate cyclase/phosphodiesterase n=1 Tax=Deinococcus sp. A31D244 TaxID=3397675 RepID=UPI0039DFF30F